MSDNHMLLISKKLVLTLLIVALLGAVLAVCPGCGGRNLVVQTGSGKVKGQVGQGDILVFKGIPYARPPVGELRWKPPEPPEPWSDTFKAALYGPVAPQTTDTFGAATTQEQSEDSLSLNVWTPGTDNERRPVMVWIHGGGFTNGSGSDEWYEGSTFAMHGDVVMVTLNYRLGALGFLYLGGVGGPEYGESGNLGMLDQVAALKWVRENIAAFGGDPDNVTIFGESAGSMSVCTLMGMPAAKGLFRRAIGESGALNLINNVGYSSEITGKFMTNAGVNDMAGMKSLTPEQIIKAQSDLMAKEGRSGTPLGPVIDGSVLPEPPLQAIAKGSAAGVDFLTGTNLDEVRLWMVDVPLLKVIPVNIALQYMPMLKEALGARAGSIEASYKSRRPDATDGDISMAITTDVMFRVPGIRVVEAQSAQQPKTWMYLFTWPNPVQGGILGACHALEIPFVFDHLHAGATVQLLGNDPPQKLADIMHNTWIAFAKTGDPNNKSIPNWPAYNTQTRATMIFNVEPSVENDPYGEERRIYNGIPFDSAIPSL
ncbi:MAG: carboxylesterase/lipase family protein [Actinobacteria bacterium]|nr:carboxylesterase/lipase family protein [Actinomycetota bacterium]